MRALDDYKMQFVRNQRQLAQVQEDNVVAERMQKEAEDAMNGQMPGNDEVADDDSSFAGKVQFPSPQSAQHQAHSNGQSVYRVNVESVCSLSFHLRSTALHWVSFCTFSRLLTPNTGSHRSTR